MGRKKKKKEEQGDKKKHHFQAALLQLLRSKLECLDLLLEPTKADDFQL